MPQQELAIVIGQALGGLERHLQKRIDRLARRIFGHLHHHRRHQVEGLADVGKLLQHLDHAVVVLERVHARPGQLVLARDQVLIKRLVHVP